MSGADDPAFRTCLAAMPAGALEDAAEQAVALTARHTDDGDSWHLRGVIASRMERFAAARDDLRRARTLAPDRLGVIFDLAVVEGRLGDHATARPISIAWWPKIRASSRPGSIAAMPCAPRRGSTRR